MRSPLLLFLPGLLLACTSFSGAETSSAGSQQPAGQGGAVAGSGGTTSGGGGEGGGKGGTTSGEGGSGGGGGATSSGSGGVASGSGGTSSGEGGEGGGGAEAGSGGAGTAGDAGMSGAGQGGEAGAGGDAGGGGSDAGQGGDAGGGSDAGAGGDAGSAGDAGQGGGCGQGEALCDGACVDLASDPAHCGECGATCTDKESCEAGSCVVVQACGNGVQEPGEACDGPLSVSCAEFLGEGFGGAPFCTEQCTVDLSACAYCGNGVRDVHEACEGSNLGGATCSSLGAGNGQLACKNCQHDLSGCASGICGYTSGLENTAWAAEGGCMKRPNQSRLIGPAGTSGTFHAPGGVASPFSPQLVVNPQGNLIFQGGQSLYRWSGTTLLTTKNTPHTGSSTLVMRANGTAFRVTDQSVSTILNTNSTNPDLNTSTNNQGGGPLTTSVALVENIAYYARADGKMLRTALSLNNLLLTETHHTSPVGLRGSIAHDPKENRLYVHQDCSKVGDLPCKLLAINRNSGSKAWEADVGPATSAPCHAAVGAGGIVYATCGDQARFFLPQNQPQLTAGFSAGAGRLALAPALRSDGTVYLLFDGDNPVLLATTPQLQVLWSRSLAARPLGAPLLDAAGSGYLCLQDRVISYDTEGEPRWEYPFSTQGNTHCAMAIRGTGQLDVVTSTGAYRIQGP